MHHRRRPVAIATCLSLALLAGCAAPTAPTALNPAAQPATPEPAAPTSAPAAAPSPQADELKDVWIVEGQALYQGAPAANLPITVYDAVTDAASASVPGGIAVLDANPKTDAEGRYRLAIAGLAPGRRARLFVNGPGWALSTSVGPEAPAAPSYRVQTQLLTYVNPFTGRTTMVVAAGRVQANTNPASTAVDQVLDPLHRSVLVYPAQQINLDRRDEAQDLRSKVEAIDPSLLAGVAASAQVIEAIIKNKAEITKENQEFLDKHKQELERGNSILEDRAKQTRELEAVLKNVAKGAVDQAKIQDLYDRMNVAIGPSGPKLTPPRDLPPVMESNDERLTQLLQQIEAERRKLDEANKAAMEAAKQRAEQELRAKLEEASQRALDAERKAAQEKKKALEPVSKVIQQAGAQGPVNSLVSSALQQAAEAARQGQLPTAPAMLEAGLPIPGVTGGVGMLDQQAGQMVFTSPTGRQVALGGRMAPEVLQQQISTAVTVPKSSGGRSAAPAVSPLKTGKTGTSKDNDDGERFSWSVKDGSGSYTVSIDGEEETMELSLAPEDASRAWLTLTPPSDTIQPIKVIFDFDTVSSPDHRYLVQVALRSIEGGDIYAVDPEPATLASTRWTGYQGESDAKTHIAFLDPESRQNELVLDAEGALIAGRIWYPVMETPPESGTPDAYRVLDAEPAYKLVQFWRSELTD